MHKVLTILPPRQSYYQDREAFALIPGFDPVYATDHETALARAKAPVKTVQPRYIVPSAIPRGAASLLGKVVAIEELLTSVAPELVVTFELHSRISFDVANFRSRLGFRHLVVAYETTPLNRGLWGMFPLTRFRAHRTAKMVDRCLAYSSKTETALISAGVARERIIRTRPGIYLGGAAALVEKRAAVADQVLFVGALKSNKGLLTLIDAMSMVRDLPELESRSPRLVIAGMGPLSRRVRECAKGESWIDFRGYVASDERDELYRSSALFVCPSEDIRWGHIIRWEEQTATSVLEAMAAGLPVIGSDSGTLPEILQDSRVIFRQGSPRALALSIRRLLLDDAFRTQKSEENRVRAERDFEIHDVARFIGESLARS